MEYLDVDLDVSPGTEREYPVSLRSPAGQAHETMHFPFDILELENHLLKLQNALLNSGGGRRKALTTNEEAVQRFGQSLFEALLPPDLRNLFYESKREAARQGKGVRLRLHLRAPKLAALPWEYLYDPRAADYLCLARQTPLVRYLDLPLSSETLTVTPPLRILVMLASPSDQEALNVERERERMRRALEPLEVGGLLKMHWLEGQTWRDLHRALQGGPWHVFHFIGHGGFDDKSDEGVLALANEHGKTELFHATKLARLLANHGWTRLAVLNACEGARGSERDLFSSTAATVARMGVPAVLAMQEAITDHAAIELTRAFYEALAMGLPVDTAVTEARVAISLEVANTLEWGTPVLYLRASDGVLFQMKTPSTPAPSSVEVPSAPSAPMAQEPAPIIQPVPQPTSLPGMSSPPPERPAVSVLAPRPKTSEAWLEEGSTHYQAGRYAEALAACDQALRLDPINSSASFTKGKVLFGLERYEEALAAYARTLQLDPTHLDALVGKGGTLFKLKYYKEMLLVIDDLLQLDPHDTAGSYKRGLALIGRLQPGEDIWNAFDRLLQLNPRQKEFWFYHSIVLLGFQRYEETLVTLDQAHQTDPDNAVAYLYKGLVLHRLRRRQDALDAFDRAIQLNPAYALAYHNKGLLLEELGHAVEAGKAYQQAREHGYNSNRSRTA